MELTYRAKEPFLVIGREGSTEQGPGFIQRLWAEANERFPEVEALAKRDENGAPAGFWGAMSDFGRNYLPWEDGFSKGLYLAGVEALPGSLPPDGWTAWTIPGFVYACVENTAPDTFSLAVAEIERLGTPLAFAAHDFTCPKTGKGYIFLPIRRLLDRG